MVFDALTTQQIQVGEPTAQALFQKIKDNFDDHESRLSAAETGATVPPPIEFFVAGVLQPDFAYDGLLLWYADKAYTLTGFRVFVKTAGASGTLTVDVERKRGAGAWTSILDTPVDVVYTAGDLAVSSGTLALTDVQAGDFLRLNLDSVQAEMEDFGVNIEREVA